MLTLDFISASGVFLVLARAGVRGALSATES